MVPPVTSVQERELELQKYESDLKQRMMDVEEERKQQVQIELEEKRAFHCFIWNLCEA